MKYDVSLQTQGGGCIDWHLENKLGVIGQRPWDQAFNSEDVNGEACKPACVRSVASAVATRGRGGCQHQSAAVTPVGCAVFRLEKTALGMAPGLPRTSLTGSALPGLLAELGLLDGPAAKPSFIEGMGQWLGWADAIPLAAALNMPLDLGQPPASTSVARLVVAPAEGEFVRVRAALGLAIGRTIDADGAAADDWRRAGPNRSAASGPMAPDTDFAPYRQRCIELQQAMQAGIAALRGQARQAVARLSPEMSRLAAIDAVMDEVLGARASRPCWR